MENNDIIFNDGYFLWSINNNYNCEVEEIDYCDGLFVIFFRLGVFFLVYLVMCVLRLCLMMWIFVGLVLEIF